MTWMHQHGNRALMIELALLAVCTVGAIATDNYWQRRATRNSDAVLAAVRLAERDRVASSRNMTP